MEGASHLIADRLVVRSFDNAISGFKRTYPQRKVQHYQIADMLPFAFDPSCVNVTHVVRKGEYQGRMTVLCELQELGLFAIYARDYGSCTGCSEWEDIDAQNYDAMVQSVVMQVLTSARPEKYTLEDVIGVPRELHAYRQKTWSFDEEMVDVTSFVFDGTSGTYYVIDEHQEDDDKDKTNKDGNQE